MFPDQDQIEDLNKSLDFITLDDVFEEEESPRSEVIEEKELPRSEDFGKTIVLSRDEDIKETSMFNSSAGSAVAPSSLSEHFNQLFVQLETYMKDAPIMDCVFIRRRIAEIKSGMRLVINQFEEINQTGRRLEKFMSERLQK